MARRITVAVGLLVASSVTLLLGHCLQWWRTTMGDVMALIGIAVISAAILVLLKEPAAMERWRNARPELYWFLQVVFFLALGLLAAAAIELIF